MYMGSYTEHAGNFAEAQDEMGDDCPVITWNGETIKVIPRGITLRGKNSSGGLSLDADFQFSCLAAEFGDTLPVSNQVIGYLDNKLKIETVAQLPGGLLRIAANHYSQGA